MAIDGKFCSLFILFYSMLRITTMAIWITIISRFMDE